MKIDRDAWLADVLGYDVFRVSVEPPVPNSRWLTESDLERLESHKRRSGRAFLYARVPCDRVDTAHHLNSVGFNVVDVNVTLARKPTRQANGRSLDIAPFGDIHPKHQKTVLEIAQSSFTLSRFHLDPEICESSADRIYNEWALSYINRRRGKDLLVALVEGGPIGFLAFLETTHKGEPSRVIDLIAVDRKNQGQGIGSALVSAFIEGSVGQCAWLRVGTQAANIRSIRLYERTGFRLDQADYVLHAHVGVEDESHSHRTAGDRVTAPYRTPA